jgi:DsbC/DsbD-like thiol-disulfide interchange protein
MAWVGGCRVIEWPAVLDSAAFDVNVARSHLGVVAQLLRAGRHTTLILVSQHLLLFGKPRDRA